MAVIITDEETRLLRVSTTSTSIVDFAKNVRPNLKVNSNGKWLEFFVNEESFNNLMYALMKKDLGMLGSITWEEV